MDLKIKYENGQMTIHMNSFFPTSQARLKKLLNVVALDENRDDHKHFKAVQAGCLSEFNRCIRQKEQFLKHLEILEQRK